MKSTSSSIPSELERLAERMANVVSAYLGWGEIENGEVAKEAISVLQAWNTRTSPHNVSGHPQPWVTE